MTDLDMDNRPFSVINLSQEQAIALLRTSAEALDEPEDRYIAASQLVNYPGEETVKALVEVIQAPVAGLFDRITRRKSVEILGYLKAVDTVSVLRGCLQDDDPYTVDNAVWSIGEVGTQDDGLLAEITQLLTKPTQNHRLIMQTLAKLGYRPAAATIRPFLTSEDLPTVSAAISAIFQLTGDASRLGQVVEMLQHENPNPRRSCIQDLVDSQQYGAIANIIRSPVSMVFRRRGIRLLAESGMGSGQLSFTDIEPALDQIIRDHPQDLDLVHEYDQTPTWDFVLQELYSTDFARCYLATQTILDIYPEVAPAALIHEFSQKAKGDYGAHYHVIKLLGWLKHAPAYDLLIEALHNPAPQFKKSRTAAAIALAELNDPRAIADLKTCLSTTDWSLAYATLMALQQLQPLDRADTPPTTTDFLVQEKWLKAFT